MGCYACFVGFNGQALGRNGCIDCCMASLGCCWCVTMDQRIAVRAKYGLVENMDCLASYVFCCCAVCLIYFVVNQNQRAAAEMEGQKDAK